MGLTFQPLVFSGLTFGGGGASLAIGSVVSGADPNSVLIVDSTGKLADVPLVDGQFVIGRTGNKPIAGTITGTTNQIIVFPGSGSITLSLPQDINTTSSPTFANLNLSPSGAVDITGAGTLAIGTGNADIINIGNAGAIINIQGDTFYQNVTDLNVQDKNITVNYGGSAGSASNAGIQVQENSLITAYIDTTSDRNSWELKAPAQTGIVTISPGASGFTIDQGSHDPVTIGAANGLTLSPGTQQLSLALSSTSTTGALSSTDWNTFNNKQPAGSYITALTGDGSASGPGSASFTLSTVNLTTGTFGAADSVGTFTVNGKGLITAASNTSIQIAESQVTNLVSDLGSKLTAVSVASANGFAGTSSGTTTPALTLSTTVTGILKGNGTAISTATAGSDYVVPVTGDIVPTTWSSLANNTSNQSITGLSFATSIKSFETLMNIFIDATTDLYTTVKITGTRNTTDWTGAALQVNFSGASITGLNFTIDTSGQVKIDIGNIIGFTSGVLKFRAITL